MLGQDVTRPLLNRTTPAVHTAGVFVLCGHCQSRVVPMSIPNSRLYRDSVGVLREAPPELGETYGVLVSAGYIQAEIPDDSVTAPNIPDGVVLALAKVEGTSIRYRDDGFDPTPSVGWPLDPGETLFYDARMTDIRLIATGPGAILNLLFYGQSDA